MADAIIPAPMKPTERSGVDMVVCVGLFGDFSSVLLLGTVMDWSFYEEGELQVRPKPKPWSRSLKSLIGDTKVRGRRSNDLYRGRYHSLQASKHRTFSILRKDFWLKML